MNNEAKPCVWLQKDAPLAVKFNTQCLGEALVQYGPPPPQNFESVGKGPVTDECHPIAVENFEEFEAFNINIDGDSIKETFKPAMVGYRAYVEIVGFAAVGIVLIIACHSMCCHRRQNGLYQPIKDPVV